jgi:tetratricopeptide (TPR) repeat protein
VFANALAETLDFPHASEEYERALALAPGNAPVLQDYGVFAALMGNAEQGVPTARRAVDLDPLNRQSHISLASALYATRQYAQGESAQNDALALDPTYVPYQWEFDYIEPISSAPCKARSFSGSQSRPAAVAPAGSNRSSRGGNETAEAFDVEGRHGRLDELAGHNVSER